MHENDVDVVIFKPGVHWCLMNHATIGTHVLATMALAREPDCRKWPWRWSMSVTAVKKDGFFNASI
jgi:hypothetical protein